MTKYDYMTKKTYNPLWSYTADWAGILYEKLMVEIKAKNRRKSINKPKLIPYLKALFTPKMAVPLQNLKYAYFLEEKQPTIVSGKFP